MAGGMHGRGHAWWGACVVGGMHGGGHAWQGSMHGRGLYMAGGMCGRGHAWQGVCTSPAMHTPPSPPCGQCSGGIHPTGMHSCLSFTSSILKKLGK